MRGVFLLVAETAPVLDTAALRASSSSSSSASVTAATWFRSDLCCMVLISCLFMASVCAYLVMVHSLPVEPSSQAVPPASSTSCDQLAARNQRSPGDGWTP